MSIQCGVVAVSVVKKENPNRKLSDGRAFFVYAWSWVFGFFFASRGGVPPLIDHSAGEELIIPQFVSPNHSNYL